MRSAPNPNQVGPGGKQTAGEIVTVGKSVEVKASLGTVPIASPELGKECELQSVADVTSIPPGRAVAQITEQAADALPRAVLPQIDELPPPITSVKETPSYGTSVVAIRTKEVIRSADIHASQNVDHGLIISRMVEHRREAQQVMNIECRVQVLSETAWLARQEIELGGQGSEPLASTADPARQMGGKVEIPVTMLHREPRKKQKSRLRRRARKSAAVNPEPDGLLDSQARLASETDAPSVEPVSAIDNPAQIQGPVTPTVKIAHSVPAEQLPVELPLVTTTEPPTKNGAVALLTWPRMASDTSTSVLPSHRDSFDSGVESLALESQNTKAMNCATRTQPTEIEANGAPDTVAQECGDNLANRKPEADTVAELICDTGPETGCGGQVGEPEGILEPSRRKVLVVDDDLVIRMLLKMGLGAHGYDCVTAEHGKAAQAILQTNRFDLLVVDLLMPVMDGLAFIRWLRQTAQDSTPVLVFTNVDDPKIARDALACGADSLVCKPVRLKDLVDEMNRLVAVPAAGH